MGTVIARLLLTCVLAVAPASAFSEVSDKMGSPERLWTFGLAIGAVAFFVCWRWPRIAFVLSPLLAALVWGALNGNADVNAAYRLEIGEAAFRTYQAHLFASTAIMPLAAILGGVLSHQRRRHNVT